MPPRAHGGARLSIRQKLLLAVAASALVLALIGVGVVVYSTRQVRSQARANLNVVADLEAARLEEALAGRDRQVVAATDPLRVAVIGARGGTAAFRSAVEAGLPGLNSADTECLMFFLPSGVQVGKVRCGGGTGMARALVRSAATRGHWVAGPAYRAPDGGRFLEAIPLTDATGRSVAVVVAEFDLAPIAKVLQGQTGSTFDGHLVQRTGRGDAQFITATRFRGDAAFRLVVPKERGDAAAVLAVRARASVSASGLSDDRNHQVMVAVRLLDNTPWRLVEKVDQSEAFAVAGRVQLATVLSVLSSLGVLIITLLAVWTPLNRRLRRITAAATSISRGDLHVRIDDPSRDEVGVLSAAFDRMSHTLAADIRRREGVEAQLASQARRDALTELPNRIRFQERLAHELDTRGPGQVAVLFCDLDEFKSVNDELGHAAGDRLLAVVAQRFAGAVRPTDLLARFGGDEFVIVCTPVESPREAEAVAGRLQNALADPVTVGESEAFVSVSIGIALNDDASTPESMVRDADAAMYRAKGTGRRRYVVHSDDIREQAGARLTAATALRRDVEAGRLALEYQPIVHLASGEPLGFEALVRWPRPTGVVPPAEFVPRAQELGLGPALDRWVIGRACAELGRVLTHAGTAADCMWVNVSPGTIAEPHMAEAVLTILQEAVVPPRGLILEVTEEALSQEPERMLRTLSMLRAAGVRIAIDDFGTGHSNLARLRHLPVDIMKLDRMLVQHIDRDRQARDIVQAVVHLGRTLNLMVVAEGVERPEQRAALLELECDCGQGWLFARPMPGSALRTGGLPARRTGQPTRDPYERAAS